MSPARARTSSRSAATALIAVGIVAVVAAAFPPLSLRRAHEESLSARLVRAILLWQKGDLGQARQEFALVVQLKRRAAELAVEEL